MWKRLKEKKGAEEIRIKFIGTVSPVIKNEIEKNGLTSKTDFAGFLPYKDMLSELMKADYLLVCATEKRHVPGKLFEYLRTGKPIIAFGDDNEEVKSILQNTNSGMIFGYNADPAEFFEKADVFKTNVQVVKEFDRTKITTKFGRILDQQE